MYKGKFKGKPKPPSFVSCIPRKDKLSEHSSHCHFTVIANFDLNLMYSNFIFNGNFVSLCSSKQTGWTNWKNIRYIFGRVDVAVLAQLVRLRPNEPRYRLGSIVCVFLYIRCGFECRTIQVLTSCKIDRLRFHTKIIRTGLTICQKFACWFQIGRRQRTWRSYKIDKDMITL